MVALTDETGADLRLRDVIFATPIKWDVMFRSIVYSG